MAARSLASSTGERASPLAPATAHTLLGPSLGIDTASAQHGLWWKKLLLFVHSGKVFIQKHSLTWP